MCVLYSINQLKSTFSLPKTQITQHPLFILNIRMSKEFKIYEYEVVYLSYDEPNAQANWENLLKKVPYARHVHGIKGSDAAHKEIARHTNTERVTVIDGDVTIDELYLQQIIEVDDSIDTNNTVFSWPSKNSINGLLYGNGGIKCWPVKAMLEMKTHEAADPDDSSTQVDFCWALNYMAIDKCYSTIRNNDSKLQAWRAGFREGVKMVLESGNKIDELSMLNIGNLNRLRIWMTVGLDVENGIWAILGARQACHLVQFTDWDYTNVRDFDYLNDYFDKHIKDMNEVVALQQCKVLGSIISTQTQLCDPLSVEESKFFKSIEFNPDRQLKTIHSIDTINESEYDIVMVTYNELNAEENWNNLKNRFPRAKRVDGVKGIHNAHIAAAKLARTKMFWVVDGDAVIHKNFHFDYIVHPSKIDHVHVWRSKNPVNDLEYGFGGIKLFPREMTINMDMNKPDMTTSISTKYKPVFEVSNITSFNTDAFSAWRSGFRECCKLASKVIDRQNDKETLERLEIWCTVGLDRPFGKYTIAGAIAGEEYGNSNIGNLEALKKINDFEWLQGKFDEQHR